MKQEKSCVLQPLNIKGVSRHKFHFWGYLTFQSIFYNLKPENLAFNLMQITSYDRLLAKFRRFYVYVFICFCLQKWWTFGKPGLTIPNIKRFFVNSTLKFSLVEGVSSSVKLIRVRFRWLPNFTFASVQLWKFFKWFRPSITYKLLLPRDMMLEFEKLVQIVSEIRENLCIFSTVFSQKF